MLTGLETLFTQYREPESLFAAILPAIGEELQTDRCFLHVRHPITRMHRVFCWRRRPEMPDVSTSGWQQEQAWEQEDPMFAAALQTAPSIFVEDVETASPDVLNLEFERKNLGHRSLIHAHLCQDHQLWGILQPCLFEPPRNWTDKDRKIIADVIEELTPIVIGYVKSAEI
jgi:GAF domain-containing protein